MCKRPLKKKTWLDIVFKLCYLICLVLYTVHCHGYLLSLYMIFLMSCFVPLFTCLSNVILHQNDLQYFVWGFKTSILGIRLFFLYYLLGGVSPQRLSNKCLDLNTIRVFVSPLRPFNAEHKVLIKVSSQSPKLFLNQYKYGVKVECVTFSGRNLIQDQFERPSVWACWAHHIYLPTCMITRHTFTFQVSFSKTTPLNMSGMKVIRSRY